jgi:chemotaxis signal transduction protein
MTGALPATAAAATATTPAAAALSLICCGLGAESYGIDMKWVRGIYGTDRMRRREGPNGQIGTVEDATGEVPVFPLAQRIRRPESKDATIRHIVVFPGHGGHWGLLVDRVSRALHADRPLIPLAPAVTGGAPLFEGVLLIDDDMVLMLAPDKMSPVNGAAAPEPKHAAPARPALTHMEPVEAVPAKQSAGRLVLFSTTDAAPSERPLTFGVSLAQVLEVLELLPVLTVPLAPPEVLGLVKWRNQPVPVLDLGMTLGLAPSPYDDRSRLIIMRVPHSTAKIGFIVRPTVRLVPLPTPHWPCQRALALPPSLVLGAVDLPEATVVVPDLGNIWHAAS